MRYLHHRSSAKDAGSRRPPRAPASIRPEADWNSGVKRVQRVRRHPIWLSQGINRDSQTQSCRRRLRDFMADARARILRMFRASSGRGRVKMSLCALFAPVSEASLQHQYCLGREFGKPPLPVTVSLSQSHGTLAFPTPPPSPQEAGTSGLLNPTLPARISEMRETKVFATGTVH
jgi:hypothetical protein